MMTVGKRHSGAGEKETPAPFLFEEHRGDSEQVPRRELLTTTGMAMPRDFPRPPYEKVWGYVSAYVPPGDARTELGFGWNGVAYRFRSCADADIAFRRSLTIAGVAPPAPARYVQERALFLFFTSGQAVIESLCYAHYAMGAILESAAFPIGGNAWRQVTLKRTAAKFAQAFPHDGLTSLLAELQGDAQWEQWNDIRNVLAHRSAPGRLIRREPDDSRSADWKLLALTITPDLTRMRRAWLSDTLKNTLVKTERFARRMVPAGSP